MNNDQLERLRESSEHELLEQVREALVNGIRCGNCRYWRPINCTQGRQGYCGKQWGKGDGCTMGKASV
jgi:hypothetical protein